MSVNVVNQTDGSLLRVAGGTLYADTPIGTISPFGGSVIPSGYLLCDGQAVSRTNYSELFAIIGTAFGAGDGSTTFNVPDLRESVPKGAGLTGKSVSAHLDADGLAVGEFLDDRIKAHEHNVYVRDTGHAHSLSQVYGAFPAGGAFSVPYIGGGSGVVTESSSANIQVSSSSSFSSIDNATTTNGSNTNEVKSVGVNYIIKAKQVSVPFDLAEYIRNQNVLSDYETVSSQFTAEYDGFITAELAGTAQSVYIKINNVSVANNSNANYGVNGVSALFKKGDAIITNGTAPKACYYKLRDYSGRS